MSERPAGTSSKTAKRLVRQRVIRFGFLALLAGGLALWNDLRKPRSMTVELDLAQALPGDVSEVDLVFRRGEHLLARKDLQFGNEGAPQILREEVQATPGDAELEADLIYRGHTTARTQAHLTLSTDAAAHVQLQSAH